MVRPTVKDTITILRSTEKQVWCKEADTHGFQQKEICTLMTWYCFNEPHWRLFPTSGPSWGLCCSLFCLLAAHGLADTSELLLPEAVGAPCPSDMDMGLSPNPHYQPASSFPEWKAALARSQTSMCINVLLNQEILQGGSNIFSLFQPQEQVWAVFLYYGQAGCSGWDLLSLLLPPALFSEDLFAN